ncbi:ecdysone oxidase-like [Anticarsia gemmatalis]|uniref:ecdysone oxidase-like n=1 Tax=Anticarsia gemmatalis TaxID=129554 RepID=UPI003F75C088
MSVNTVVNEFFKMIQSWSSVPLVQWLLRGLALSQAVMQTDWPQNYRLKDGDRFDFIVVGSGSAGAIVAARLSEVASWDVLLIEAGGDPPPTSVVPGLFPTLQNTEYDWSYHAQVDEGIGRIHPDGMIPYTRGKMLGGCSSINYLIYSRGVPQDYEEWNRVAPGWDWQSALYYFKKLEGMTDTTVLENPENAYLHSPDGPVKISRPVTLASTAAIDDSRLESYEEIGIKRVLENNGPEILGAARPHLIIHNGRRYSTAEAYLKPAKDKPNLKVAKYSEVTRVLIDPETLEAYGVEVATPDKEVIKVYATKEVIVSGGVINSPKLLLHSGLGPEKELSKLGIDTLVDLPVGKNFHDHQIIQLVLQGKPGLDTVAQNLLTAPQLDTVPIPVQSGFFRLNDSFARYPSRRQPHFQFFNTYIGAGAAPVLYIGCRTVINGDRSFCTSLGKSNTFNEIDNILVVQLHPLSRGEVKLKSNDPFEDPIINLGYYRNKYDLAVATEGLKYMSTLINTTYFRKVRGKIARLHVNGCDGIKWGTDEYWQCYARNAVTSIQHGVGTCRMGPNGVVNERLKVYNVAGLRVVDASVIPSIPSGNTNTPVMMIGEKAADMIKEEYGLLTVRRYY